MAMKLYSETDIENIAEAIREPQGLVGKNLFDKNNYGLLDNAFFHADMHTIGSRNGRKIVYIPCKSNTTYSVQIAETFSALNQFAIGTTTETPRLNISVSNIVSTTSNKQTTTTSSNALYLVVFCYNENYLSTFEEIINTLQIEEGSTATPYEPYCRYKVRDMDIGIDNLVDKLTSYIPHTNTSGNPLNINSIPLKPKELDIVGDSKQNGTPSPDNPIPINVVKSSNGVINYNKTGKNLFDKNNSSQILNAYIDAGGTIISYEYNRVIFIPAIAGKTYFINKTIGEAPLLLATTSTRPAIRSTIYNYTSLSSKKIAYTIPTNQSYLCITLWRDIDRNNNYSAQDVLDGLIITEGSNEIPYEPYKHDTIPFNIGTTEFCKLPNGVADKLWINLKTGQYGKTGNIGKVVLDGTEQWVNLNYAYYTPKLNGLIKNILNTDNNIYLLCSHFPTESAYIGATQGTPGMYTVNEQIYLRGFSTQFPSITDLKTWLSTHNVKVYYELKTLTTEVLGTLSKENLAKLVMYNGTNNISIDRYDNNGAEPIIEIDYYTQI